MNLLQLLLILISASPQCGGTDGSIMPISLLPPYLWPHREGIGGGCKSGHGYPLPKRRGFNQPRHWDQLSLRLQTLLLLMLLQTIPPPKSCEWKNTSPPSSPISTAVDRNIYDTSLYRLTSLEKTLFPPPLSNNSH